MYKVSIITPIIENDIKFIKDCMDSINNQIYKDIEWIIVGNENINISSILKQYDNDLNINVIEVKEEVSIGEARNIGIENSKGKYLFFLDIDDFITKHNIHCLVESAESEGHDVVIGKVKDITTTPDIDYSYEVIMDRLIQGRNTSHKEATIKQLNNKCINTLFNKYFIINNEIKFSQNLNLLYDLVFTIKSYNCSTKNIYDKDAIYLKRFRNDQIRYASISTRYKDQMYFEVPTAYIEAIRCVGDNLELSEKMYKDIYSQYKNLLRDIHCEDDSLRMKILSQWSELLKLIKIESMVNKKSTRTKLIRKELTSIKEGNFTLATKIAKSRIKFNHINKGYIKKGSKKRRSVYNDFYTKLPIRDNHIMYESFLGKNMSDSPKYIYEHMYKNYKKDYKHIWVFNEPNKDLPDDVIQVKRFSWKHLYYLAISKYWVSNMRQPIWYKKRDEQVFLETWHGTPLKRLVFDMDDVHSANKNYKMDFYEQSRAWDYLISANAYSSEIFKSAFLYDNNLLELGYPRNDLLHHEDKESIALNLKKKLGIPLDKKIVLYAPTWRDDEFYKPGHYKFKLNLDLQRLRQELGEEYFFILRTHYFIADHLDVEGVEDFVYNASKYDDITELYLLADALITDYSSVFFDFANLKRPILFYTYDLEKYRDKLRGFYLDIETECPGPIVMNNDELIKILKDFNGLELEYKDRIDKFYDRFCYLDDGNASKRISEEVILKTSNKHINVYAASE